jgi:hypothetical protein
MEYWLVVKKGAGQINLPPSVDAGVNKVITLPTNSVSVTGTATDNNTIISTLWSQVSGPSTASYCKSNIINYNDK